MRFIAALVLILNVLLLAAADVILWMCAASLGLFGLAGIGAFFLGYCLSGGMAIAPRDYWRFPAFDVFKKKLSYANSWAVGVIVVCILAAAYFGDAASLKLLGR